MTELKPCPFCGLVNEHKPSCFFTLEKVARAYPPDAFVDAGGPEALEDAWDTRATDAELERLRADAEIGRKWRNDGSLETWFPITAEGIEAGYALREKLLGALVQILGWRELRDSNDIPIERIEDIARAAIDEARKG